MIYLTACELSYNTAKHINDARGGVSSLSDMQNFAAKI